MLNLNFIVMLIVTNSLNKGTMLEAWKTSLIPLAPRMSKLKRVLK